MPSLDLEESEEDRSPITRMEMQMLLDPLRNCLERMESALQDLSSASLLPKEVTSGALNGDVHTQSGAQNVEVEQVNVGMVVLPAMEGLYVDNLKQGYMHGVSSSSPLTVPPPEEAPAPPVFKDAPPAMQEQAPAPVFAEEVRPAWQRTEAEQEQSIAPLSSAKAFQIPGDNIEQAAGPKAPQETHEVHHKSSCYEVKDDSHVMELIDEMKINHELHQSNFGKGSPLERIAIGAIDKLLSAWGMFQEPDRSGCVYRIASNNTFQTICMLVISFNSVLAVSADWQIQHVGMTEPSFLQILEIACLIFFILELVLRLGAHRCWFFMNSEMHWNIFDFVLVSISVFDLFFESIIGADSSSNVGFMRLLRLLKLARIFRSLRSFRFFKSLAVLLESFQKSFVSLFWGFIMLCFVLYMFSLIFMQALLECLTDENLDPLKRQAAEKYFGSLAKTIVSLYMSVTGGDDWSKYYHIVGCAGSAYAMLFVLYTFVLNFALFNILTGSLVEKAMASSKPDRADRILNQRRVFAEQRKQFLDICKAMDENGNGTITRSEFEATMCQPAVLSYMASIGIEVHDVELFFETVARAKGDFEESSSKEIPIDTFVEGCMHMKGTATAIDMQRQLYELHLLHNDIKKFEKTNFGRYKQVESLLCENLRVASQLKELQKEQALKVSI